MFGVCGADLRLSRGVDRSKRGLDMRCPEEVPFQTADFCFLFEEINHPKTIPTTKTTPNTQDFPSLESRNSPGIFRRRSTASCTSPLARRGLGGSGEVFFFCFGMEIAGEATCLEVFV